MNKNIIVFSLNPNSLDISDIFQKVKFLHVNLILCNNAKLFYKKYNCNVELILYYPNEFHLLQDITKKYPKEIKFNLVNIYDFISDSYNFEITKCYELANKNIMTYFLNTINISSTSISLILIKRILINAINFNITHIKSSLIYYTFSEYNLLPKTLIPIIRDYLKNWYKLYYEKNIKAIPNFTPINKIKINDCLNAFLNSYKFFVNNFSKKNEFLNAIDIFFNI